MNELEIRAQTSRALGAGKVPILANNALPKMRHATAATKKDITEHTASRSQVSEVEGDVDTAFLGELGMTQTAAWLVTLNLNGHSTQFKLDTGAEVTAISEKTHIALQKPQMSISKKTLYGPSRHPLQCIGTFPGKFSYEGKTATQNVFVIKGLKTNLLGLPAITALELAIRVVTTEAEPSGTTNAYRKQFPSLFKGLGNLGEPFEICLKTGAVPHCIFTPRHVPLPLRDKVKQELDRMESTGVIKKIDEPTSWCAGMVAVPKKEGKIRICVDLKPLNECVLREIHPLPKVDETLAQLSGAKLFSKLDANSGFWQIPLAKNSQQPTKTTMPRYNKKPRLSWKSESLTSQRLKANYSITRRHRMTTTSAV